MKQRIQYETDDGYKFDTFEEAKHHEDTMQLGSILFREVGARMLLTVSQCNELASVALHNLYVDDHGDMHILEGDAIDG